MAKYHLPDGSLKEFPAVVDGATLAASIGAGLAKAALAVTANGQALDLNQPLPDGAKVSIITDKSAAGVEIIRHSIAAQVLARAVKDLYPQAKLAIGPVIEHGFYYDIDFPTPPSSEDLPKIESRMREIVASKAKIVRKNFSRAEALAYFASKAETYKQEIIQDTPAQSGEVFGMYHQEGTDFVDLCRGPHVPALDKIGAFKLTHLAGAYWRGDSKNKMLTRLYGVAFNTQKELDAHLHMLAEAAKRDHRKIGPALDLFHFEEYAPGAIFWHPKGWKLFNDLIGYMRQRQEQAGYVEVNTPDVMDRTLWEISGHWQNYRQNMFTTTTEDERVFALKPMNCPGGVALFKHGIKSYRDLPIRMAEFGKVHRYEPSGALHGLMRVRHFTQDDAHIFCTLEQMDAEFRSVIGLVMDIYKDFGFTDVRIKFSTRPDNRLGDDAVWDKLEAALEKPLKDLGLAYSLNPGEGAFYGPKLEFVLKDCLGRDWQCGTLQVDMNLPERFDISYVAADGSRQRPVMLHRALFGSLERFTGILIENFAGNFPLWLAPTQVVLTGITDKQNPAVEALCTRLKAAGLRAEVDLRNEKVNYKIREHSVGKVPVIGVVGNKELAEDTITIRRLGSPAQTTLKVADLISQLQAEVTSKALPPHALNLDEEAA